MEHHVGNREEYGSEYIKELVNSPLKDKHVLFLGSSVTYGECSLQDSISEYFAKRFGCVCTKEAVSGTTLVDTDETSYVSRLIKNVDKAARYDLFICQLSTNDASQQKPLGNISDSFDASTFDKTTITGAIEFIISYVQNTWKCPVMFYTGSHYDSTEYEAMVNRIYEISEKWGIHVIDLWRPIDFNNISEDNRSIFMNDPIHPTKAGYMKWWCPEIEKQLISKGLVAQNIQ